MNLISRLVLVMMIILSGLSEAVAFSWQDLWVTKDQQAKIMMDQGQFKQANDTFLRADWRATAAYRAKDYTQAAMLYQSIPNQEAHYNKGNALAHIGKYSDAIEAYNKALAINPNHQDALYNRHIVEELLKKQNQDKHDQDKPDQSKPYEGKPTQDKPDQSMPYQDKPGQDKPDQSMPYQDKSGQDKPDQSKPYQGKPDQDKPDQGKQNQDTPSSDPHPEKKISPTQNTSRDDREKQQAKEQWLNLIPDDPGGLLREKFLRDHLRRQPMWDQ